MHVKTPLLYYHKHIAIPLDGRSHQGVSLRRTITHHAMKPWQCCTVCSAYVRVWTHIHVWTHMHQWECQWELKQEGGVVRQDARASTGEAHHSTCVTL